MPQFRLPGETVDPSDAAETLERPAVRLRPGRSTAQRMAGAPGLDAAPPPITAEVEAQDILIETYAEPACSARSSAHAPRLAPSAHTTLRSWSWSRSPSSLPPPNPPGPRLSRSPSSWNAVGRPPTVPAPSPLRRTSRPSASSVRPPAPCSRSSTPPPLPRVEREMEPFDVSSIGAPSPRRREMDVFDISSIARSVDRAPALLDISKPSGREPAPVALAVPAVPESMQPFAVMPSSPVTRPMLVSEHAKHGALAPTAHRPSAPSPSPSPPTGSPQSTFETASSLAPVAMPSSPARAPRYAADPTMQLRPQRRSPALVVGVGLVAVLFAGVAAGIAIGPDALARGPAALYERLRGYVQADEANVATASPVMPVASAAEPPVPSHPFAVPPETPASVPVSAAPQASALPPALPPPASSSSQSVPVVAIDALPKSNVEPNMTLVTLPRSAKGHRIFVDGRVVGNGAGPLKVACGTRKIKIGTGGKLQVRELPCGGELALD